MSESEPPNRKVGQFQPGQSGNPSGRPKSESVALRQRLACDAEAVAAVVITKALGGDMQAARLILERISPPLKACASAVMIDLPQPFAPLASAGAIIQAAATGQLAPDIASQLVGSLALLCRISEIEELRERLEALERATKAKAPSKS